MPKLSEMETKAPNILIYGPPGSGKTAFTMTLGEHLELLDLDKGSLTGLTLKDDFLEDRKKVEISWFEDTSPQKAAAFFHLKRHVMREVVDKVNAGKYPYQAIALDSLTAFGHAALRQVQSNSGHSLDVQPEIQLWNLAYTEMDNTMNLLLSLPIPFILVAHSEVVEIDGLSREQIHVVGKKYYPRLPWRFDEIWYAKAKGSGTNQSFSLQTVSTSGAVCRTRLNVPDGFEQSKGLKALLESVGYSFSPVSL